MKKTFIVLAWVSLIFGILYWPKSEIPPFDERSINIFAWGDILDPMVIADFEKESGIKVHMNYYASNEELVVKIKATRGKGTTSSSPRNMPFGFSRKRGFLKSSTTPSSIFYRASTRPFSI